MSHLVAFLAMPHNLIRKDFSQFKAFVWSGFDCESTNPAQSIAAIKVRKWEIVASKNIPYGPTEKLELAEMGRKCHRSFSSIVKILKPRSVSGCLSSSYGSEPSMDDNSPHPNHLTPGAKNLSILCTTASKQEVGARTAASNSVLLLERS